MPWLHVKYNYFEIIAAFEKDIDTLGSQTVDSWHWSWEDYSWRCQPFLELYSASTEKNSVAVSLSDGDETSIRHRHPETKQESMQWKHPRSPSLRKARTQTLAEKCLATTFWDTYDILLIDYTPQKKSSG